MEKKEIVVEGSKSNQSGWSENKTMYLLPIFLSLGAILCGLFYQFLPLIATNSDTIYASVSFMFIGYVLASSALTLEIVKNIKDKGFKFSLSHLLIILAFAVVIL